MNLRELRARKMLSMRELAKQSGVSLSSIYAMEAGRTIPRMDVVRKLVAFFQVDPMEVDEFRVAIEEASKPKKDVA